MRYIFLVTLFFIINNLSAKDIDIFNDSGISLGVYANGIINWDDIPYAQAPVGDLRWKAPREVLKNNELIESKVNNFCIQKPSGMGGSEFDGDEFFSGSEDCLYLDIKAPKSKSENLLPVMFWIHGGGNTSGFKDIYDFTKMVKKHNVIVVTINYRLGPFGWFTHPSIQSLQEGDDKSSNFGTLDIIAALKWVQSNISLFGGNPDNVTIFGESAGGHNVLSLIASKKAKGLFHKAISQSGYTTSISTEKAYMQDKSSSTSEHTSWKIVNKLLKKAKQPSQKDLTNIEIRKTLKEIDARDFFINYSDRPSYQEIPLLTADGIVIPFNGLKQTLSIRDHINIVPTIAGSNRDEVKLWLASAEYFVGLKYSFFGSLLGVPRVALKDEDAFELFNSYRSRAWKIRGVDKPLRSLALAGNNDLYAYRYDWDDHRKWPVANFKKLIGAAHATEIPLLTGNNKLVGDYGFLIYPRGPSKSFLSKNMMSFWTNFAKTGKPGTSSNSKEWTKYNGLNEANSDFMVLDNRKNLKMGNDQNSFKSLVNDLYYEKDITDLEKCVVLLQMLTFVGDDLYDDYINHYPGKCIRSNAENFLKANASFIDY
ncbi:carboxylesterase family protein [Gammaproteobacteria bacterium]|nr:carboxylesterase family protein [Gammaproteobacteria bacterium]MDC1471226.1 carboxylesterase family protein [Gammaproteobacteria bacterium]